MNENMEKKMKSEEKKTILKGKKQFSKQNFLTDFSQTSENYLKL